MAIGDQRKSLRVSSVARETKLGEFTHAKFYVNHDWYAKCI